MRYILFSVFFAFLFVSCSLGNNINAYKAINDGDASCINDTGVFPDHDGVMPDNTIPDNDTLDKDNITDYDGSGPGNDYPPNYYGDSDVPDTDNEIPDTDSESLDTDHSEPVDIDSVKTSSWIAVNVGDSQTCAIKEDHSLYCWGNNAQGELGDGTSGFDCPSQGGNPGTCADKSVPVLIEKNEWTEITAGAGGMMSHTCGISADRQIYCWGSNVYGELGDGTTEFRNIPTKMSNDTWSKIAAGTMHTCAIKEDRELYCWGDNRYGSLGDGTTVSRTIPTKIARTDSWLEVATGGAYTCAINNENQLYCWGANNGGKLGDGTILDKFIPTKIGDDTWASVTTGSGHTCAIKTDNSLYCWGYNFSGQLGDGSSGELSDKNIPIKIGEASWSAITAGAVHTCGITIDGTLYCWGRNATGNLGDGTTNDKNIPTRIGHEKWSEIKTGGGTYGWHTCGRKVESGKLYCWGSNGFGQLGNGTKIDKYIPTLVVEP